jgi:WD40 repeat protein
LVEPLVPGDPRQLGRFYLDGRLGAGGQGVVYEGYGPDGERVAVKALHGMSEGDRDLLRKETWAWRQVASFCTAKVLHADLDGLIPFVVSEHVAGPDLRRAVERGGPYGPGELRRLAIGVATALVAIHQAKVVHRDLKPENILLGPDGPRVIDFGLARIEELPTTTGVIKGTLRYMPPERYNGRRGDTRVDVWGWGAVVLFAATGRHAFDGETGLAIQSQVAIHDPDTSMLEEPLRSLVSAALSKDPEDRPDSEDLLLGLVGGVDLAEAKGKAAPGHAPGSVAPSRAELAEAVFASLGTRAQEAVPRMFLRLVAPGERAEDTLRSARRTEFTDGQIDQQALEQVLRDFTEAGILVWEDELVTLSSAALIRAWPRLREWVEADREGLALHQGLSGASWDWDEHGRKNSDLYQGTALARALSWAATGRRHLVLNLTERSFLDAGSALARRRSRFRVLLSAVLAVLLVIAVGAAAVALNRGRNLARQRDEAVGARIANVATTMRRLDPVTAKQLAVVAGTLSPNGLEARSALAALHNQWEQYTYRPPGVDGSWVVDGDRDSHLMVYGSNHDIKVVDVDARKVVREFKVDGSAIETLSVSADGKSVAVFDKDGAARVWDTTTATPGTATFHWKTGGAVISPAGGYVVNDTGRTVVSDARTGKPVLTIPHLLGNVVITPDDRYLISTLDDTVRRWDLGTGKSATLVKLQGSVFERDLAVSPDGRYLGMRDGNRLGMTKLDDDPYTFGSGTPQSLPSGTPDLYFSSDGRYLALGGSIWDTFILDQPIFKYSNETCGNKRGPSRSQTFGPGNRTLRCVDDTGAVNVISLKTIFDQVKFTETAGTSVISKDGSTIAFEAGGLLVWDAFKRVKRGTLPIKRNQDGDGLWALSDNGAFVANALKNGDIEIWDVASASKKVTLATRHELDFAKFSMTFSPDGRTLALLTGGNVSEAFKAFKIPTGPSVLEFWDLASGSLRTTVKGTADGSYTIFSQVGGPKILFSPDGRTVLSAADQGIVEAATGKRLVEPSGLDLKAPKALSTTGLVAEADDTTITVWDGRTLQRKYDARLGGETGEEMAFSPDGQLLAVADATGQIRLWDVVNRRPFGLPLTGFYVPSDGGFQGTVRGLAFSPDGSTILSITGNHLRTHLIGAAQIKKILCIEVGPLSRADWNTYMPELPYRKTC